MDRAIATDMFYNTPCRLAQLVMLTVPLTEPESTSIESPTDQLGVQLKLRFDVRNQFLTLFVQLLSEPTNMSMRSELVKSVGFDFFLHCLNPNMHDKSAVLTLHALQLCLSARDSNNESESTDPFPAIAAFRSGQPSGMWLKGSELVTTRRSGFFVARKTQPSVQSDASDSMRKLFNAQHSGGFQMLNYLLLARAHLPETYFFLSMLLFGKPVSAIGMPPSWTFEFDALRNLLDSRTGTSTIGKLPTVVDSRNSSGVSGLMSGIVNSGRRVHSILNRSASSASAQGVTVNQMQIMAKRQEVEICCPEAAVILLNLARKLRTSNESVGS
ncbi:hypothetical protein Ciccas_009747 [Cichlidogyrus casuarinus]|uniref:Uncharacterized protein n=1 Tax=Cichlidogyrus casuarinus TaxID=1844966 RepID=A0ABD2PW46_9PLAT